MLILPGGRRGETRQASGQTHFTLCQLSDGFVCCYLGQVDRRTFTASAQEVLQRFRFALMHYRMASGRVTFRHHVLPEAHLTDFE